MNTISKFLLLLTVSVFLLSGKSDPPAFKVNYNQHTFDIYEVDHPSQRIKMYWKDAQGEKLKSLANLKKYTASQGHELLFATNAGMYMPDNSPQGLYVENKKELNPIDLAQKQSGNFYMQPNGVFFITASKAQVVTSDVYNKYKNEAIFATQSGPMLVIDGAINSNFKQGSINTYIRSGVGITGSGKAIFAISEEPVNFYDFAALFKDSLKCNNALYLDGAISKMYLPALNRLDADGSFGVMIGVTQ